MLLPKAHHEIHGERQALLLLPGVHGHLIPGLVDGEVVFRHYFSEVASTGDHRRRRGRREQLGRASRHAGATPQQEVYAPGPWSPGVNHDGVGEVLV